ncbi:hypothetical protein STH2785 [Symbiobacterium thermophilum IAM 14863]|uniref:Alkyl hydroperoxide reductase subunit C/ Thiol specific antioxidant domain-containing protein n=1 Tax=Symbiobacterium thermophilum (strain DSM 24528 / JCM 14929 / IAM 14863 / T) TaxID=292459 RepID=Q67KM8_SYMTH|nr:hypothetical protein STH2785 [Symbiobacterium thermophilum IAM 14863]
MALIAAGLEESGGLRRIADQKETGVKAPMVQPGEVAPDFTLESTEGPFTLSALRGRKRALIIFYPKDNTPG